VPRPLVRRTTRLLRALQRRHGLKCEDSAKGIAFFEIGSFWSSSGIVIFVEQDLDLHFDLDRSRAVRRLSPAGQQRIRHHVLVARCCFRADTRFERGLVGHQDFCRTGCDDAGLAYTRLLGGRQNDIVKLSNDFLLAFGAAWHSERGRLSSGERRVEILNCVKARSTACRAGQAAFFCGELRFSNAQLFAAFLNYSRQGNILDSFCGVGFRLSLT